MAWLLPAAVILAIVLIRRPRPLVASLYLAFGAMVAGGMAWFQRNWDRPVTHSYALAAQAAEDSTTTVVEGRVEHFRPEPEAGHQDETFTVGGVDFSYSHFEITGGFNQSQSHGGPIREGLQVRIHYVPPTNRIVKLEIAN